MFVYAAIFTATGKEKKGFEARSDRHIHCLLMIIEIHFFL